MMTEHITEDVIEKYFLFKTEARLVDNFESARKMIEKHSVQVDIGQLGSIEPVKIRKALVKAYADQWIPSVKSEGDRFELLTEQVRSLSGFLNLNNFKGALWVGGSFANGKPNGKYSDLDLYFGLNDQRNEDDVWRVLGGMDAVGIVLSEKVKAKRHVDKVVRSGEGIARVNAMTTRGVDVDIHCLGKIDLQRMTNLYPGEIARLEEVEPYVQMRTDFIGQKREVKVDSKYIENYFAEGVPVKGIYLDNLSAGGGVGVRE